MSPQPHDPTGDRRADFLARLEYNVALMTTDRTTPPASLVALRCDDCGDRVAEDEVLVDGLCANCTDECPVCEGRGEVADTRSRGGADDGTRDCPECDGTGRK